MTCKAAQVCCFTVHAHANKLVHLVHSMHLHPVTICLELCCLAIFCIAILFRSSWDAMYAVNMPLRIIMLLAASSALYLQNYTLALCGKLCCLHQQELLNAVSACPGMPLFVASTSVRAMLKFDRHDIRTDIQEESRLLPLPSMNTPPTISACQDARCT